MRIEEALDRLELISAVADRSRTFDGLRAVPTLLAGFAGLVGGLVQARWVQTFADPLVGFFALWTTIAVIALSLVLSDMSIRYWRDPTARARRMTIDVLTRLMPSLCVGAAIAMIVVESAREVAWMLPGLWSLLLGLGIFAASPLLPRTLGQVGYWYVACGFAALIFARGEYSLSPLAMVIPFAGGQCLTAWLIHRQDTSGNRCVRRGAV